MNGRGGDKGRGRRGEGGTLLAVEVAAVGLAAPLLAFPSLRPRLTAAALGLLAVVWVGRWVSGGEPWPVTPFNGALLLFSLMVPVAMWASALPEVTLPKATGVVLGLATFRAVAFSFRRPRTLGLAAATFVVLGLGITAVGVLGAEWPDKVAVFRTAADRMPRVIDTLPGLKTAGVDANQLAGLVALYLPFPAALVVEGSWPQGRRRLRWAAVGFSLLLFALLGTVLLLTQSRSGWIGGGAGLLTLASLWGLTSRDRRRRAIGLALPIVAAALIAGAVLAIGPTRLGEVVVGGQADPALTDVVGPVGTFGWRVGIWRAAAMAVQDFAFTGCGLATFREVVHILYPVPSVSPGYDIAHAHNIFLQTALDLGFPGLIAYLALLMVALAACWRAAREGEGLRRWVALGLAGGLVGLHAYGMTDALALGSKPAVAFWFALGLVAALTRDSNGSQIDADKRR